MGVSTATISLGVWEEEVMNLMGLMVAVAVMSIGALTSAYFLIDPPIALSRLSAQAEADAIVESLRQASWRGQRVKLIKDNGQITGVSVDDIPMKLSSACTLDGSTDEKITVRCDGSDSSRDSRQANFRYSRTALIGGQPCDSDLFPTPAVTNKPTDNTFICTEWNNTLPDPKNPAGHFDIDSYSGFSTKGLHAHRWDERFVTYISPTAPGLFDLMRKEDNTIPCGRPVSSTDVCSVLGPPQAIPEVLPVSQPFYLLITNGKLSPMVAIRFRYTGYQLTKAGTPQLDKSGKPLPPIPYPEVTCSEDTKNLPNARPFDKCFVLEDPATTTKTTLTAIPFVNTTASPPSQYTVGNTSGINYYRLDYLYVGFSQKDPQLAAGVLPTATGLVNGRTSTPGACGEYRNGAFVIQAVSDIPSTLYRLTSSSPDPTTKISTRLGTTCAAAYGMPTTTIQSAPGFPLASPSKSATISGTPFAGPGGNYISNGGTGLAVDNVIYELSIFWHANSGYTDSMTTMFKPLVPSTVSMYINR
jgi:hypothetical protein